MIIKPKVKDHFVAIPNYLLWEFGLSAPAMGLLAFITSMPSNWNPQTSHMCKMLKMSPRTLYKYMRELVDKGLLEVIELVDEKGRFTGAKTLVLHHPERAQAEQEPISYEEYMQQRGRVFKCFTEQSPKIGDLENSTPANSALTPVRQNLHALIINRSNKHDQSKDFFEKKIFDHDRSTDQASNPTAPEQQQLDSSSTPTAPEQPQEVTKGKSVDAISALAQSVFIDKLEELKALERSAFNMDLGGLSVQERNAYERFINYRKESTKVGYESKRAILQGLYRLKNTGHDIVYCVNKAIKRGYSEVYGDEPTPGKLHHLSRAQTNSAMNSLNRLIEAYPVLTWDNLEASLNFAMAYAIKHNPPQTPRA